MITFHFPVSACNRRAVLSSLFLLLFVVLVNRSSGAIEYSNFVIRGYEGKGELEFLLPEDLILGPGGDIIVADQRNNRIQVLNPDLTFKKYLTLTSSNPGFSVLSAKFESGRERPAKVGKGITTGKEGDVATSPPLLDKPVGLALDKRGRLFVSSSGDHRIYIFDYSTGSILDVIGKRGRVQGAFDTPLDIDVNSLGQLAVVDSLNKRIQVFDPEFNFLREIHYKEETKRELRSIAPRGVHWLTDTELVVSYPTFHQVVCWDQKGQLLWRYGSPGNGKGELNEPSNIARGAGGNLLITDSKNHRIVEITATGFFVKNYMIGRGSGPGRLFWPRGIAFGKEDSIIVCDQGNSRVQVFRPSKAALILREAKVLAEKDRWDEAMPKIEQVLNLAPDDGEARMLLVNALHYFGDRSFQTQDFDRSEEYYRRVLMYNPNDPDVSRKLDLIFWASNKDLIMRAVFGIIAIIAGLLLFWIIKIALSRLIYGRA